MKDGIIPVLFDGLSWSVLKMMEKFLLTPVDPRAAHRGSSIGHGALCQDIYDFLKMQHMRALRLFSFNLSQTEVTNKEEFLRKAVQTTRVPNVILKTVNSRDYLMKSEGAFFILAYVECHLFSC